MYEVEPITGFIRMPENLKILNNSPCLRRKHHIWRLYKYLKKGCFNRLLYPFDYYYIFITQTFWFKIPKEYSGVIIDIIKNKKV